MLANIYLSITNKFETVKPIFTRYLLYSFALIESFALPKLIDEFNYSQYEYYKNFIFIFPSFLLGAYNGYVQLKYVYKVDYYKQLFSVGSLFVIIIASIFAILFQNIYIFLPLILIGLYTLFEQYLKVNRRFTIIFLYKPILSIITVGIALIAMSHKNLVLNYNALLFISFTLSFIIWFILCPEKYTVFPINTLKEIRRYTLYRYGYMIKVYFTGVLTSLLFSLMLFFERYFTQKYYSENLGTYSFAFNLSQIIVMILSAISYITAVELGERKDTIDKNILKNQFLNAILGYLGFLILFTVFLFLLSPYYSEFDNLIKITLLISYAKGFFFLVGTVSPLANYYGYNTYMFKGLLSIFITEIIVNYILMYFSFSITSILFINSLFLLFYSFLLLNIVFRKIKFIRDKSVSNEIN